jgi:hypothetical protein
MLSLVSSADLQQQHQQTDLVPGSQFSIKPGSHLGLHVTTSFVLLQLKAHKPAQSFQVF